MQLSAAVVSKRVSQLEHDLGTRLFHRSTRQISLTETGNGFHERIKKLLRQWREAQEFVSTNSEHAKGTVRIAAPSAFARLHIVPQLVGFAKVNPAIGIDLQVNDGIDDIIAGGFDAAIRVGRVGDLSAAARHLAADTRVLCATPGYIKQFGAPTTVSELAQHACLTTINQPQWRLNRDAETDETMKPRSFLRTNSTEVVRASVLNGLGIGLLSTWDIGSDLESGALQRVMPDYSSSKDSGVFVVFPSVDFVPSRVKMFVDYLDDVFGMDDYW